MPRPVTRSPQLSPPAPRERPRKGQHDRRIRSLARWRAGLAVAAVVIPAALFVLFARRASQLDALATEGRAVDAYVIAEAGDRSTLTYRYEVGGREHRWEVRRDDAPLAIGQWLTATYLPDDPSFSRPIGDRRLAAEEAAANRSFAWKVVLGLAGLLCLFTGLVHRDLARLRSGAISPPITREAYRRRLALTAVALLPLIALIGELHYRDAVARGESVVPVAIGSGLSIAVIAVVFSAGARWGPEHAAERSARVIRRLAPIAIGIAALRVIAMLSGH